MKVCMKHGHQVAIPGGGLITYSTGSVYDLPPETAEAWVREGRARLVETPPAEVPPSPSPIPPVVQTSARPAPFRFPTTQAPPKPADVGVLGTEED